MGLASSFFCKVRHRFSRKPMRSYSAETSSRPAFSGGAISDSVSGTMPRRFGAGPPAALSGLASVGTSMSFLSTLKISSSSSSSSSSLIKLCLGVLRSLLEAGVAHFSAAARASDSSRRRSSTVAAACCSCSASRFCSARMSCRRLSESAREDSASSCSLASSPFFSCSRAAALEATCSSAVSALAVAASASVAFCLASFRALASRASAASTFSAASAETLRLRASAAVETSRSRCTSASRMRTWVSEDSAASRCSSSPRAPVSSSSLHLALLAFSSSASCWAFCLAKSCSPLAQSSCSCRLASLPSSSDCAAPTRSSR
mmetsp:Transcript_153191/g.293380  ORF Transcript_153191/g.293380 Transcript_153191/m.293380 type:complete len:319 (-) Transcript_153191:129-1085(-)